MADLKEAGAVAVSRRRALRDVERGDAPRARVRHAPSTCPSSSTRRTTRSPRARRCTRARSPRGSGCAAGRASRRTSSSRATSCSRRPRARATTSRTSRRSAPCASCARRRRAACAVTAEVTPHHLMLTDAAVHRLRHGVQGQPAAPRGGGRRRACARRSPTARSTRSRRTTRPTPRWRRTASSPRPRPG